MSVVTTELALKKGKNGTLPSLLILKQTACSCVAKFSVNRLSVQGSGMFA